MRGALSDFARRRLGAVSHYEEDSRMSDIAEVTVALPDTESAVRKVLEAERRKLRAWAAGRVRDIESQRDRRLRGLDQVALALAEGDEAAPKAAPAKQKRSRKKRGQTAAAIAERRRHAVHRFLVEQRRPLGLLEIRRALRLSEFSTRSALKRLIGEEIVLRIGTGSATRYEARPDGSGVPAGEQVPRPGGRGTVQGRLLATIDDRGSASAEELAQAVRAPREEVQKECGALVREEEIQMARRDGRAVYVSRRAA